MDEVKYRSGSRIKLHRLDENVVPADFIARLREYAHKEERVQAIYLFALRPEGQEEQPSLAVAIKTGLFSKTDEAFLQVVDEIQLMLPEELSLNLYRFGASEFLARYCAHHLEPVYLRSAAWLDKQRKKLGAE